MFLRGNDPRNVKLFLNGKKKKCTGYTELWWFNCKTDRHGGLSEYPRIKAHNKGCDED